MNRPYFSLIVPVYNEEGNLEALFAQIKSIMSRLKKPWEILFINDGSTDRSETIIKLLQARNPQDIVLLNFTRNFGQTAAFAAGFDHAKGEILITLDADLQNDPNDIPMMLDKMTEHNADIISGWRKDRQDPLLRSVFSKIANKLINSSVHSYIHDLGCSLRIYKRETIKNINLYGEMHRFIPILASNMGATIIEVPVHHHSRKSGQSKYGFVRTFKVLLDLVTVKFLTGYQTKPIYMFGATGIIFIILSFLAAILVTVRHFFLGGEWVSPMLFIMTSLFNVGVLCILMGLLAEIQVRTWFESSGKKGYILKND